MIIFAFLFGLSMDYEVFILTRMREEYDATGSTSAAVQGGLGRTGRLVTSAALILFFAFAALASAPGTDIKVFGTALGADPPEFTDDWMVSTPDPEPSPLVETPVIAADSAPNPEPVISGSVRGHNGGALAGVPVTLIDTGGRQIAVFRTGPEGSYRLRAPTAGTYLLAASPVDTIRPRCSSPSWTARCSGRSCSRTSTPQTPCEPATARVRGIVGVTLHTAARPIGPEDGRGAVAQRNRERLAAAAARRRSRRRAYLGPVRSGPGTAETGTPIAGTARAKPSAETISTVLLSAAHEHCAGDAEAGPRIGVIVADRCAEAPGIVAAAVRCAVVPLITAAWERGWSPEDLHQFARRRLNPAGVSYLVDAIADQTLRYAKATIPQRWLEDLRLMGAVVWWESDQTGGHLLQWAWRHGARMADALSTVIGVLALLLTLPALPRIGPPPGFAATSAAPRRGVDQKMLARVRALLAKAESTTFPEEAEALSAKAQELMSRYSLERIVVESTASADRGCDPHSAAARRLWLDNPYVAAKAMLVGAVAEANRCRTVLSEKLGFTTVLGDEVDLEIVELLSTSLLVQATRAMVSAGSQTSRTGRSRTRSYRQSFLLAYATRIGERLNTARDAGTAAVADPARLLPVLAARERVVDELFESMFPQSVARSFSVGNAAGWHAGRAAADLAVLDTRRAVASGGN